MIITSVNKHVMVRDLFNALSQSQQNYVNEKYPSWQQYTWRELYPFWEDFGEELIEELIELLNVVDEEVEKNIVTFYV